MGEQRTNLMAHCEKLTTMLQASWDVLASVLSGRVRMTNINLQDNDLLLVYEPTECTEDMRQTLLQSSRHLSQVLRAQGKTITVLVCPFNTRIDALDPDLLEAQGWQRPHEQITSLQPAPSTMTP